MKKGAVPPVKEGAQVEGRGKKRMLHDTAQHHNMAVDETARGDLAEEMEIEKSGKETPGAQDDAQEDPYMAFHDAQEAARGSAPSQASGVDDGKLGDLASAISRGDGTQSESSYRLRRETVRRAGPYGCGKTSKGKGQFPEGLPRGALWADQDEEEEEAGSQIKQAGWRAEHERVRKGWFQNQPREAAQALGAPVYTPAAGAEQMFASMQAMLANLSAKIDDRDKEWARAREEDRLAATAQQTQIAAYIEEKLEAKMVAVKRYVSAANTTAHVNGNGAGRGRCRTTSPTLSASSSSDTLTATQHDNHVSSCEATVRDSRTKRVTKRRTQLSDGEDRNMPNDASTPR